MNDSSHNRSNGKMLSDDQLNGLLSNFFRLETPAELNQPFSVAELKKSRASSVAQVKVESVSPLPAPADVRPGRRFIVSSVLATLAMSLVVLVATQDRSPKNASTASSETEQTNPTQPDLQLMNVSPQADLKGAASPVGEDGVTLEETEKIELKPQP